MSVQTQIDRIKGNVTDAFNSISNKGGTVPASKVSENLASAIDSIPTGVTLPELTNPGSAQYLLKDYELYDDDGNKVTGTMPNNGQLILEFDGVENVFVTIPKGFTSGGAAVLDGTISRAVYDAKAALGEKGVTVPNDANVTHLADLIRSIETGGSGGGLPNGVSALDGGTFTLASDSSPSGLYAIQHSMGKVPNFFIVAMKGTVGTDCAGYLVLSYCVRMSFANSADVIGQIHSIASGGGMVTSDMTYRGMASTMFTDNNFSLFLNNRPFKAGVEYAWVCGVIDGLV